MPAFKEPGFQERNASAARARDEALAKLRAKPAPDPEVMAARAAAHEAREVAAAAKRVAAQEAKNALAAERKQAQEAAAQAAAEALAAAEAAKPAPVPEMTDAERKAARDAKYAARKQRKGK